MHTQKLSYGLNIPKKAPVKPTLLRPSIFGAEDGDSDTEKRSTSQSESKDGRIVVNRQLSTFASYQTKKTQDLHREALEADATIYDYDAIYDDLKQAERQKTQEVRGNTSDAPKARYIEGLLKAAEVRKQDRLRAEEKKIQREREAEGDEFEDKEKFVTAAYKAQQEELRRLEAEEKEREANQDITKKKNLSGFYRNLLETNEKSYEATMQAYSKKSDSTKADDLMIQSPKDDIHLAREALREGKMVTLNDDNQIVDRRQLLEAGLNVVKKPTNSRSSDKEIQYRKHEEYQHYKREEEKQKRYRSEKERERFSRQIEDQLLEAQRKKEEEERLKEKAIIEKMKKRTTEDTVMDARSRYLARKKAKIND